MDEKLIKREQLFITTKLPDLYHHKVEDGKLLKVFDKLIFVEALREELRLLNLDYSDLHLIETPWQQTEGRVFSQAPFHKIIFLISTHAVGIAVARPNGFETDFLTNPHSRSAE